ncbi:PREDICTED: uncharacterized protein LOC108550717 isoform X1 [Eufriesea mexicana]|uniref:uncharacterized protein LOC108550717 isoform X1 n=1 Tax=Eufriesea mexicana TaxID=516756 RepID=UPI00083C1329|nr:PREDICTED: uncharacterized protein LOC108550717 isoform X1 [Eufriesea mexicana]XP_017760025.1 PREDICTED: uncharacterized protein LOC108550717 isoform X1 [Eufriesea mexicana]
MLANCTLKDTGPVPAYGTTRYNGAINLKENINQYYINAPRKIFFGFSSPCTKIDKRSKDLENKRTREKEDNVCKNVTKSSVLSVCGPMSRESSHCTCQDEKSCICLENGQKESKTSSENSLCYTDWKEIYKLTDTSDTKLTNSCERLLNCIQNGGDTNTYLNLFEPHPRKERQIKGKDLPPSGYNVTLILPQCVCLQNYQKDKQIPNIASDETIRDEICETISELCMPNIPELSWDIMQSGIVEKIPEKYTRNIFE